MNEEPTPVEPLNAETPEQPEENHAAAIIGDDGRFTQEFRDKLPEGLGKHSWFDKYKDIEEAVKGSINSDKLAGRKAEDFWLSKEPADIQRRKEIMGVPSKIEEYEVELGDIPEGLDADAVSKNIEEFKKFAFENGWPKEMVQQAIEYDMAQGASMIEKGAAEDEQTKAAAEVELRKEWKGDKFEYNVSKAKDALEYLGLGDWIENPVYGNDPKFIKDVFEKIVPLTSDDTIIEARQSQSFATLSDTLSQLEGKMRDFKGSTTDPVYRKMVTDRGALLQKLPKNA